MAADPAMTEQLLAMLPPELRSALDAGADPAELAQTLLTQRLQQPEETDPIDAAEEEPWPELGWTESGPPRFFDSEPASIQPERFPVSGALPDPRLLELARALGGCILCFGELVDCPVCGGEGSAGWALPEPSLFAAFVLPALRRLASEELRQAQKAARQFTDPPPPTTNGHSATT